MKTGQTVGTRPGAVDILGVRVDCVDFAETLAMISEWIAEAKDDSQFVTRQLCTVNPEFVMHARRDPSFALTLQRAELCVPDGIGLLWAARRQGVLLHERVTGSDGIYHICEQAAELGWRLFLLGAAPGVAAAAAARLQTRYPALQVAGTYSGSPDDSEWPAIYQELQRAQPDILFVAYGHPQQEYWIAHHREQLPVKVAMGIGGAFDFVAGVARRAPLWMQRLGLEWLYRLLTQPWRWRRMLVLPHFAWLVLRHDLLENDGDAEGQ